MILQKLFLTNFMPYREMSLDFSGIHLACLTGENGAGKSALLDAITWALWGRARARRDEELIRLNESEMAVEFTFRLPGSSTAGGEQTYRVLRRRAAGKRGSMLLDFRVLAEDNGEAKWRSLAAEGLRQTQDRINEVLHLDYDTFVNSAFLRQGRADEFTLKTAAERKRVLADILGLAQWSVYEQRAKDQLRLIEAESAALELRLREIADELERRPAYQADLEAAQAAVAGSGARLQEAQAAHQQMEAAQAELRHVEAQRDAVIARLTQADQELAALAEERQSRTSRLAELQGLWERAAEVELGYQRYLQAVEREQSLGARLSASLELSQRRNTLETEIAEARHTLETCRELLVQQIAELESRLVGPALLAEMDEVAGQILLLGQLEQGRRAAEDDLKRIAEQQVELREQNSALRTEMLPLKERIENLAQARADCPLCGQPLDEAHRRQMLEELQARGQALGDAYRANQAAMQELDRRRAALEEQIAASGVELQRLPALHRREAALQEQVGRGEQALAALEKARVELAEVVRQLSAEDYAHEARAGLQAVLREAEALGYDAAAHAAARAAVSEGQPFAALKVQLDAAQELTAAEQAALARLAESVSRWEQQVAAEQARQRELEQTVSALQARLLDAAAVEAALQQARLGEAAARQQLGAAQQRLAACDALEKQQAGKLRRREELAHQQGLYEELREAFGVRGVPAMLIEAAVPEIEAEANHLLARMTGGRMHVQFETQRETQAGELRETLEIKISDELGTRPYENFSGGEQYKINFAIRVALSRLLARRAGAQLQTLVVDEGFGTQDSEGRQRLVEALNAIQDEFAQVLVVTHIEELKDAFPTRIEVTKTPEGSQVELV